MSKKLSPWEAAFERLYFINKLNNAGEVGPQIFKTQSDAEQVLKGSTLLDIVKKLSAEEIKFLTERIEAIQ